MKIISGLAVIVSLIGILMSYVAGNLLGIVLNGFLGVINTLLFTHDNF